MARYATPEDLTLLSLPANAMSSITDAEQQAALDAASDEADSYLGSAFRLPLNEWGMDLRQHVCSIAALRLMNHRGYNPQAGANDTIRLCYEDAIRWLENIARGRVKPAAVLDTEPRVVNVSRVYSTKVRGW